MRNEIEFFDISLVNVSLARASDIIIEGSMELGNMVTSFVNADCINKLGDISYKDCLLLSDLVFGDGIGVKIGCKLFGDNLVDNVNGTDLFPLLMKKCDEKKLRVYFLGARDDVVIKLVKQIKVDYPNIEVSGYCDGYFNIQSEKEVIDDIGKSQPHLLFVAMGAPTQEKWIYENLGKIKVGMALGVGGLFDFFGGRNKRAPIVMRKIGVEWLYRIYQEPKRLWRRYVIGNPIFLWKVFSKRLVFKKFSRRTHLLSYNNRLYRNMRLRSKSLYSHFCHNLGTFSKRTIDLCIIIFSLPVTLPFLVCISVLIKMDSRGPVLYKQVRVGKNGEKFNFFKFRSMYVNSDSKKNSLMNMNESKDGVTFKIKNDPRITLIGKFLRKYSIDELPQLFNVLKGDMALVGPRPPVPSEVVKYTFEDYKRLEIIPGITCIWQVSGRSDIPFRKQVKLDIKYIREHGFIYDLKLLFRTVPAVIFGKGAY